MLLAACLLCGSTHRPSMTGSRFFSPYHRHRDTHTHCTLVHIILACIIRSDTGFSAVARCHGQRAGDKRTAGRMSQDARVGRQPMRSAIAGPRATDFATPCTGGCAQGRHEGAQEAAEGSAELSGASCGCDVFYVGCAVELGVDIRSSLACPRWTGGCLAFAACARTELHQSRSHAGPASDVSA